MMLTPKQQLLLYFEVRKKIKQSRKEKVSSPVKLLKKGLVVT